MNLNEEGNLILRVTQLGLKHQQFTLNQVVDMLKLNDAEKQILITSFIARGTGTDNPNHILVMVSNSALESGNYEYSLSPTAFYNYVDYLEIKEAKWQSSKAFIISIIAFLTSVVVGGIQIYLQLQQMADK